MRSLRWYDFGVPRSCGLERFRAKTSLPRSIATNAYRSGTGCIRTIFYWKVVRRGVAMTAKQVLFRSSAREKVLRGTAQLSDAVRITLGPKSKSVLIQKKWGAPIIC